MRSVLLVVLWVEEGAIALTAIMHRRHLIVAPGLACSKLLTNRSTASSFKVTNRKLIQTTVHEQLLDATGHHSEWRGTIRVLLPRAPVHAQILLLLVLVHIVGLLLVIAGKRLQLLLIHILKWGLHSVLVEPIQLIWPEIVHHTLIHIVAILFMIKVSIHLLIEKQMRTTC